MDFSSNDRDTLRIVSAFKEIKSRGTRRALVMLLEELAQKDGVASNSDRKGREQPCGGGWLQSFCYSF